MSGRATAASDSDDDGDVVDITEYSDRGKKLKNSKSAWTTEAPTTMRQEIEVAESEAMFYRGILDVIIAHLDPNMEDGEVERLVLPPQVPSDVRKKLRKYRVEAKNIIEFIDDKMGNDSDDDKENEDEKAEAVYLTTLIEKLCSAVKGNTISSKFKLPRVPVVDAERKDRLKGYRKDGGEIVERLKRLKIQKIDRITQTDFLKEDCKIQQTRVTEYIDTGSSTQTIPESKKRKLVQRSRQTQTDFDDQDLGKAPVTNPVKQPNVAVAHPPSYSTVMADHNVTGSGVANANRGQGPNTHFLKTVKGAQGVEFIHQQAQCEQQYHQNQHHNFHHFGQQQQQQQQDKHVVSDNTFANVGSRNTADHQDKSTEWQNGESNRWSPDKKAEKSDGSVFPNTGDDRSNGLGSGSDFYNDLMKYGGGVPQRPSNKSNDDYINTLEAEILRLSCRISLLETQLHDSQRTLVVSAYSNDAVLERVSKQIKSSGQEMSNINDETLIPPISRDVEPSTREMSDLADKNRPIKLAERFARVYDREWIDIFQFETTDMKKSEQKAIADILEILQGIYNICIRVTAEQIDDWHTQIQASQTSDLPEFLRRIRKLKDNDLLTSLKQTQIEMSEQTIPSIRQEVVSNEAFTSFYGPELASCERFVFACVDVCWLMAVRHPPMLLDFTCKKGSKFDKDVFSAYTKMGKKVDFLVWPPVYLYETGQLLYKGIVQLL
ncbi:uncharacterized protein LOC110441846 [Mizuhopecten yessoensis]|uniref:Mitochondria-eating protein C-terminal domain-containing protein n=1 Tax=Mizuhopecten yessoensis TaxID=6573 RepID=A0A210PIJ6_MIZYE|nr:uncharacterized protein LOC110441846 [Mizuhopecten yessoensis]XP_021340791.1 uncharacterized protein LOC110441846 [Mizuhopecten yessoensis]OWF36303.1 hypothetical protein KP79_PYT12419 [Mizuhopecten yessoensis]